MNSLEFIEKEIAITKSKYKEHLKFNQTAFAIKDEEKITALQQIKTILKAWEIIKNALELTKNELGEEEIDMKVFFTNAKVEVCDTRKEFKILKKALEVEDENL